MKLTPSEIEVIKSIYDKNKDGQLSDDEIAIIVADAKTAKNLDPRIAAIFKKYDTNNDGKIDDNEIKEITSDIKLSDGLGRYAGYSAGLARLFRYLAFTSDFGEALRPVVSARIVNSTYAVSIGYCFADVGWESYKHHKRDYKNEHGQHQSMTQVIVERTTFQAVASIGGPFLVIHTTVDLAKHAFKKYAPRFTKFGPSIVGLSIIPLLPVYLDEPVEHGLEIMFKKFGPWAEKEKKE